MGCTASNVAEEEADLELEVDPGDEAAAGFLAGAGGLPSEVLPLAPLPGAPEPTPPPRPARPADDDDDDLGWVASGGGEPGPLRPAVDVGGASRVQIQLDSGWRGCGEEEQLQILPRLRLGETRFSLQARGQRYSIDWQDPEGPTQTNVATGKRRSLRLLDGGDGAQSQDDDGAASRGAQASAPRGARAPRPACPAGHAMGRGAFGSPGFGPGRRRRACDGGCEALIHPPDTIWRCDACDFALCRRCGGEDPSKDGDAPSRSDLNENAVRRKESRISADAGPQASAAAEEQRRLLLLLLILYYY